MALTQLQRQKIYLYSSRKIAYFCSLGLLFGCSSLPDEQHKTYEFPRKAFLKGSSALKPQWKYEAMGEVRAKAEYPSFSPNWTDEDLCRNYFNKAVTDLVSYAKKEGADAVIDVESVVLFMDDSTKTFPRPECSDDGGEGQVMVQGRAIKWQKKL